MALSKGERILLLMLSEIYEKIVGDGEIDHKLLRRALLGGHLWALEWIFGKGLEPEADIGVEVVDDVVNILDMFEVLERSQAAVETGDHATSGKPEMNFGGFDEISEYRHVSVAQFLINEMGSFTCFKDRSLTSEFPMLGGYRKMHLAFEAVRPRTSEASRFALSPAELAEIAAAIGRAAPSPDTCGSIDGQRHDHGI